MLFPCRYIVAFVGSFLVIFSISSRGWAYDWERFKSDFISSDGRVIDFYQNRNSHSEGQGYGMLLAVWHKDRHAFDILWRWTRNNLQVRRDDKLLAWSWGRKQLGNWTVIDENNATDGDLCTALALLKAFHLWKELDYKTEAMQIIQSIRQHVVIEKNGRLCLMPGYHGFNKPDGLVLNPSYFIFPAFKEFAKYDQADFWNKVYRDSMDLVHLSIDTQMGLPPDWVIFNGNNVSIYSQKSDRFGYEAIRVLLYSAWDRRLGAISQDINYLDKLDKIGYIPAWINLREKSISLDDAHGGFYAVHARAAKELGNEKLSRLWNKKAHQKIEKEDKNYYSRILYLLSEVEF